MLSLGNVILKVTAVIIKDKWIRLLQKAVGPIIGVNFRLINVMRVKVIIWLLLSEE
jgi:hypothetical protein